MWWLHLKELHGALSAQIWELVRDEGDDPNDVGEVVFFLNGLGLIRSINGHQGLEERVVALTVTGHRCIERNGGDIVSHLEDEVNRVRAAFGNEC